MCKDFFLKASDEAQLMAELETAGIVSKTEDGYQLAGACLDVIGQIEGVAGFHANLRGDITDEQQQSLAEILLLTPPNHPVRVWA